MSAAWPRLSIGLPVYNGQRYLRGALDCLLAQDYTDFELIISDNASTDETKQICTAYAARDRRIRYYRNESNIGASRNYNRVFELARGELFKWAAYDDECDASMLRKCVETFDRASGDVVLVYAKGDIIDEEGRVVEHSRDFLETKAESPHRRLAHLIDHIQFADPLWGVIRSSALRRTRLVGVVNADCVLLSELSLAGQFREIPEVLFRLRRHAGSAMQANRSKEALLAWYDPRRAGTRVWLPDAEATYVQYLKGVRYASLPPGEKLLCYLTVPYAAYRRSFLRWTGGKQGLKRMFSGPWRARKIDCCQTRPGLEVHKQ